MAHGPWAGALFGATAAFAAEIVNGAIDPFIIGYVIGRAVMGISAALLPVLFPAAGTLAIGMICLTLFNLIAQSLYFMQGDVEARMKLAVYLVLNFVINFWLFAAFADPLRGLLE